MKAFNRNRDDQSKTRGNPVKITFCCRTGAGGPFSVRSTRSCLRFSDASARACAQSREGFRICWLWPGIQGLL
jgi:hypothetical protein